MDNQNELIERPSWWKRNWKWALPAGGCLTIVIVGIIMLVGGVFAFANKVKTATGTDQALIIAQQNPALIEILGEPIESDGFGSFNISIKNGERTSNSTLPIKGPKGTGTIHVSSKGEDENRTYEVFNVTIDGSDEIVELSTKAISETGS